MSRIAARFEALKGAGRKALIPFVTAGDSEPALTVPLMHAMVEAGADLIELGVPFSDPMADGPVIQLAYERALAHGVSLEQVLEMVREFRSRDAETPVVLMGYLNPIELRGYARFAAAAAEAGVDGVLTVDLPPEEGDEVVETFRHHGLDSIYLIAPTSNAARIRAIADHSGGFVYYVSLKGVTGAANLDVAAVAAKLDEIRALTDLPLGVGFGIKDAESAAAVARVADAVVVGSALVRRVEANVGDADRTIAEVGALLREMRAAMDRAARSGD